jgi:hypothetical protein
MIQLKPEKEVSPTSIGVRLSSVIEYRHFLWIRRFLFHYDIQIFGELAL